MDIEKIYSILSLILEKSVDEIKAIPSNDIISDFDSIKTISFVVKIEEAFGFELLDDDLLSEKFETKNKIIETLNKYFVDKVPLKKCLILDCDNVLWKGIAGEEDIIIDEQVMNFQKAIVELYKNGILLCICSKNDIENIEKSFQHDEMIIKREQVLIIKANRNDKATNIKAIAGELNLSADSFVFIDDSNYEIGLVNALLPEVDTVKADYADMIFVYGIKKFFGLSRTQNFDRTKLYKEQKQREQMKATYTTAEEYNRSLETKTTCGLATVDQKNRLHEISIRTNQCNLSNKRYMEEQIEALINNENFMVFSLSASDIYGDLGIVSMAVVRIDKEYAVIESFMLSCRVFDRGFEYAMINKIKKASIGKKLFGVYEQTDKNKRYENFYTDNEVSIYEL